MGKKKAKGKSGGFQSMELCPQLLQAIIKKNYRVPTPIQRKVIPVGLGGHDIVAMARTGSGKTAAFLIPVLQRLNTHSAKMGVRAVILSPSRELAMQTFKFAKELSRFQDIRISLLVGGASLGRQFESLAGNPDMIVATPGRLLHHLMEVDTFNLRLLEMVVFDEADRLFEMGFAPQIEHILKRCPGSRQTLLLSATLPSMIVEFARAGLHDPRVIRLDTELRISPNLRLAFFALTDSERTAALLHLLKEVIPEHTQTLVFAATKHHVSRLAELLAAASIEVVAIYGELDPLARRENIQKFRAHKASVLVVTDVAARGIDIPLLDCVINYHFPAQPKLFVHRVGRVARAGRSGSAFSLLGVEDRPHFLELLQFLGEQPKELFQRVQETAGVPKPPPAGVLFSEEKIAVGSVPRDCLVDDIEWVEARADYSRDRACTRAYKQYIKTRPKVAKPIFIASKSFPDLPPHPNLRRKAANAEATEFEEQFKAQLKNYRGQDTVFREHAAVIAALQEKKKKKIKKEKEEEEAVFEEEGVVQSGDPAQPVAAKATPVKKAADKPRKPRRGKKKNSSAKGGSTKASSFRDEKFFIESEPKDRVGERAFALNAGRLEDHVLDLAADDASSLTQNRSVKRWDARRKKFVTSRLGPDVDEFGFKRRRNESGQVIKKVAQGAFYRDWLKKHASVAESGSLEEEAPKEANPKKKRGGPKATQELQSKEQIRKKRKEVVRRKTWLARKRHKKDKGS